MLPVQQLCRSEWGYSLTLFYSHREQAVAGAGKEFRIQQRGEHCVACLAIETEQAPGLPRRELESGHLEVFRADSDQ
jgi:hypothetical protein